MRYVVLSLLTGLFLLIFHSCQPKIVKKEMPVKLPAILTLPDSLKMVKSENVRETPNGVAFGKLHKNETIYVMGQVGNWLLFHNPRFDSVYVWAPSAGLPYLNLFSPATYFDTTSQQFYPLPYFRKLFGSQGKMIDHGREGKELFFGDLGLGSHRETVLEVVNATAQTVQHGIHLFLSSGDQAVIRVKVDFRHPVEGMQLALRKCGLSFKPADREDEARLIWNKGALFPNLIIELERKDWNSSRFSSVIFRK